MVLDRERQQKTLGRSKRLAMLVASARTLARFGHQRLTLTVNDDKAQIDTPLLFVGNNGYRLDLPRRASATALDDGELCVLSCARRRGRVRRGRHPGFVQTRRDRRHGAPEACRTAAGRKPQKRACGIARRRGRPSRAAARLQNPKKSAAGHRAVTAMEPCAFARFASGRNKGLNVATHARRGWSDQMRARGLTVAGIAIILLGAGAALLPAGKTISSDMIGGLLIAAGPSRRSPGSMRRECAAFRDGGRRRHRDRRPAVRPQSRNPFLPDRVADRRLAVVRSVILGARVAETGGRCGAGRLFPPAWTSCSRRC